MATMAIVWSTGYPMNEFIQPRTCRDRRRYEVRPPDVPD
jgi:hypothetical protein